MLLYEALTGQLPFTGSLSRVAHALTVEIGYTALGGTRTARRTERISSSRGRSPRRSSSWSHRGFPLQHFFELMALAEIDLYRGEGRAAWKRVRERWPALKRSYLLKIQELLIHSLALRARSGLAADALDSGERRLLLGSAERDARRIEREGAVWGNGLSFAVRAGVALKRQEREEAHSFLIAAENAFETAEMGLHAAVARRCRGELLGGERGEPLLRKADRWLADQGIRNPERYAAMIVPGDWRKLSS